MSHFSVAVFHRQPYDIEGLLEPFSENVDRESPYSEFVEDDEAAFDDEEQKHGYWTNPNAKWDWYDEGGGRWIDLVDKIGGNGKLVSELNLSPNKDDLESAKRFWEIVVEGKPATNGEDTPVFFYKKEYYIEMYGSKNDYARQMSRFSTYAFVTAEGEWNEPGQMGWFGFSDETSESRKEYGRALWAYIKKAKKENLRMTIVDCHI